jgi:sn-glycerol 3-phosphate transport system ATP-binding protein
VALGRAVISEAPVCPMDEPLSNLDAQLRQDMRREIRALQRALNITMVYVTHDQTEAMSMADQVVLLRDGSVEQCDAPDRLYARPASAFAARFIGTPPMNLVTLQNTGAGHVPAGAIGPALRDAPAQAACLGVRPEHIRLAADGHAAVVVSIEYFGADSILTCRLGAHDGFAVRVAGHSNARVGQQLYLQWNNEHQHFFDADSMALTPSGVGA